MLTLVSALPPDDVITLAVFFLSQEESSKTDNITAINAYAFFIILQLLVCGGAVIAHNFKISVAAAYAVYKFLF